MSRPVICDVCREKIADRENGAAKYFVLKQKGYMLAIDTVNEELDICEGCVRRLWYGNEVPDELK